MSILKVSRLGHPGPARTGRGQSRRKTLLATPAIQTLIDNMIETMVEYYGVGLAAPQVHESLVAGRHRKPGTARRYSLDRSRESGRHSSG